ncbi:MAG: hypothetical protein NZ602_10325 [Thermoguttaceae bacterium]|nr:hypothetical protein [Thermoguttaceae bacterium]MDW8036650.1 hypothetical protein [Thermoguttaceae bacterium]
MYPGWIVAGWAANPAEAAASQPTGTRLGLAPRAYAPHRAVGPRPGPPCPGLTAAGFYPADSA